MKHSAFLDLVVLIFLFLPFNALSADWTQMTSETSQSIHGLCVSSGSDVFSAGASGTILRYDVTSGLLMPKVTSSHQ